MTQEIIEMARQAGMDAGLFNSLTGEVLVWDAEIKHLESLVKLVEAKTKTEEREACARVCENLPMRQDIDVRDQCAEAIRTRGES